MVKENYSDQPISKRIIKALPEQKGIIDKLWTLHQIKIEPSTNYQDRIQKIDGWWKGEAVQIKLRKTTIGYREDILYEVLKYHDRSQSITNQLNDKSRIGRDYQGKVIHYFVMDRTETKVYHVLAIDLRQAIDQAIKELGSSTLLTKVFDASNGTQLRPTIDPYGKFAKLLAFVPISKVPNKIYEFSKKTND